MSSHPRKVQCSFTAVVHKPFFGDQHSLGTPSKNLISNMLKVNVIPLRAKQVGEFIDELQLEGEG